MTIDDYHKLNQDGSLTLTLRWEALRTLLHEVVSERPADIGVDDFFVIAFEQWQKSQQAEKEALMLLHEESID